MTAAPANAPMADPLELGRWTVIPLRDGQWRQNPADMWLRQEAAGIRVTGLGRAQADWDRYPELLHRDGTLEVLVPLGQDTVRYRARTARGGSARQTRQAIAEELESSGAYAGGGHFPGLAFGRMLSRERRHWTFARD